MDKGKRKEIREGETSQWMEGKRDNQRRRDITMDKDQRWRDITMDKGKRTIREGKTSQWIREKGRSEKERHHNG